MRGIIDGNGFVMVTVIVTVIVAVIVIGPLETRVGSEGRRSESIDRINAHG